MNLTAVPLDRNPGEYPVENLSWGWKTVKSTPKRNAIIDAKQYPQEPMVMVAAKCGMLFIGLPFYFLAYTAVHLIRLPIVTLVNASPTAFLKQIWKLARIPFYWVGLEFAAFYGVFKPLEGRALFGDLERSLHDEKPRRQAVNYKNELSWFRVCWNTLSLKENPSTLFIGFCMQPYGALLEPPNPALPASSLPDETQQ